MAEPVRHRQTKGAATDMFDLPSPRHISTLRVSPIHARAGDRRGLPLSGPDRYRTIGRLRWSDAALRPGRATNSLAGIIKRACPTTPHISCHETEDRENLHPGQAAVDRENRRLARPAASASEPNRHDRP